MNTTDEPEMVCEINFVGQPEFGSKSHNQDSTKINLHQNLDPVSLLATSLPDLESDLGSSIMEMANFRLFWEELSKQMIPASNASTPSPLSNATHCFSPLSNLTLFFSLFSNVSSALNSTGNDTSAEEEEEPVGCVANKVNQRKAKEKNKTKAEIKRQVFVLFSKTVNFISLILNVAKRQYSGAV